MHIYLMFTRGFSFSLNLLKGVDIDDLMIDRTMQIKGKFKCKTSGTSATFKFDARI